MECDACGNVIPARLVRHSERDGAVVIGALCPECSPTGNYDLHVELPDRSTEGGDNDVV